MTSEKVNDRFGFLIGRYGEYLRFGVWEDQDHGDLGVETMGMYELDLTPERAINLGRSLMEQGMALKVQLGFEEDQRVPRYTLGD